MLASKNTRMEEEDNSKQELNWGFLKTYQDQDQDLTKAKNSTTERGFCLHHFEQPNMNKNQEISHLLNQFGKCSIYPNFSNVCYISW